MCFYRVSGNPVMLFSNAPRVPWCCSTRANSSQAFPLPPDVLEAAGLCWRHNILHPAHLWFQLVTLNNLFLKELSTEGRIFVILLVLFQLLSGFYISQRKCESVEPHGCAVLEQKARTVTDRWIWTVHVREVILCLCPWVRTHLCWTSLLVSILQHWFRMGAGSSNADWESRGTGCRAPSGTSAGSTAQHSTRRALPIAPLIPMLGDRQRLILHTLVRRRGRLGVMGKEVTRNHLWARCRGAVKCWWIYFWVYLEFLKQQLTLSPSVNEKS